MKYIFSFILTAVVYLHCFDVLKYLQQKNYQLTYVPAEAKYIFSKKKMKIILQEDNHIFYIYKYYLNFDRFPYTCGSRLCLADKDKKFFTKVLHKIENRLHKLQQKKEREEFRRELAILRQKIIPEPSIPPVAEKIKYIFIDPGHGGKDPGAVAYGYHEKNFALQIATNLGKIIKKKIPEIKIILTRTNDTFLSLAKRCNQANRKLKKNNGIFISIHLNAWLITDAKGFEVYYLGHSKDSLSERISAFENGVYREGKTNLDKMKFYERIFANINVVQYQKESRMLAGEIISSVYNKITNYTVNRGRKSDLFYVLKGALMPSILIEAGFISNKEDLKFLTAADNIQLLCEAVTKGIKKYINAYELTHGFTRKLFLNE
ncbi:MAG TPA: N-acetylmuramoyl-L-alanine amidase [Spirochaetota bacterium]|nr:N-acetylmuramoyl-L-alanine amidase [Spirochaetota bacterium]